MIFKECKNFNWNLNCQKIRKACLLTQQVPFELSQGLHEMEKPAVPCKLNPNVLQ